MKVYSLSDKLSFYSGYRGTHYLGDGWSKPEPLHCWSDGHVADINLYLREVPGSDLILYVNCSSFIGSYTNESQKLDVFVNEVLICTWEINHKLWYETVVKEEIINGNCFAIRFRFETLRSPAELGIFNDDRLLGVDIESLVLTEKFNTSLPTAEFIGSGQDEIGDLYKSLSGFYRAIRPDGEETFTRLHQYGVYSSLAKMKLTPEYFCHKIESGKYLYYSSAPTGDFIYPANYPLLMLKDAAKTWIDINKFLFSADSDSKYGLRDGHYGNFIQVDNASPRWCDLGSINNIQPTLSGGLIEFISCYVIPLFLLTLPEIDIKHIRDLMHENSNGISLDKSIKIFGENKQLEDIYSNCINSDRKIALDNLENIVNDLVFHQTKSYWSDYRNAEALDLAWQGDLVLNNEDTRYKAVLDLVKRSDATTFIDIGCNDGIFSLICVREGLKGIGIDPDEDAINKLYTFVKQHSAIEMSIAYGDFLNVVHTADLVLALALTHHLFLSQKLTFSAIAKKLSLVATHSVITEFMPDGLGGTPQHPAPLPNPLPAEYCLENFIDELKRFFKTVEVISYQRYKDAPWYSNRVLIYCTKS